MRLNFDAVALVSWGGGAPLVSRKLDYLCNLMDSPKVLHLNWIK